MTAGTNIVGPHGAGTNETNTRPSDTDSGVTSDSWFQSCLGGDPTTGTKIPAVWLNKVTALFRRAIRGRGISEVETDDDMLLKAINSADRAIENIGTGQGLYKGISGAGKHQVRPIKAGTGISVTLTDDDVVVAATGGGGGSGLADGDYGDVVVSGTGTVMMVDADAVTNTKLANMVAGRIKGRITSDGDPQDLTGSQVASILPNAAASVKGLVTPDGDVTHVLKGDGSWGAFAFPRYGEVGSYMLTVITGPSVNMSPGNIVTLGGYPGTYQFCGSSGVTVPTGGGDGNNTITYNTCLFLRIT